MKLFFDPAWLYAGVCATVMVAVFLWWSEIRKAQRLERFAASKLLAGLAAARSRGKTATSCTLLALAALLLFVTLARPQWGTRQRKAVPKGIDVLIALDVSQSMLARDIRPNRIERVKLGISNLLDKVKGDRLGLIAFAGTSFLQCPLTLDHSAFRRTLREMDVGVIKRQGTDLAQPIEEAGRSFSKSDNDRFLIMISDGEDLEQRGLSKAKEAAKEGIRIYTVGIGSKKGTNIPLDPIEEQASNFLKDPNGKVVVTTMDDSNLRSIAEVTGGKYYPLGPTGEGLVKIVEELQAIGQQKRHALLTEELPIERYQSFLLLAVVLLLGEFLLGNRHRLHTLGPSLGLLLLIFLPSCLRKDNVKRAEEAHENKDYAKAAAFYEAELNATLAESDQGDPRLYLNTGLAHLEAGNFARAEVYLEQALDKTVDEPSLQSTILNALGNLRYAEANQALDAQNVVSARNAWEKALRNYDSAVAIDGNRKAIANREELSKQLEKRIMKLLSHISGIVWRDIDGNGRLEKKEPRLLAKIYWDKNQDGEHNASSEPFVETNERGLYAIEWISSSYPVSFQLGCVLAESNATSERTLVPILPAPPPPLNPKNAKTQHLELPKASNRQVHFAYRAAPILNGFIWRDVDQDGKQDHNETGFAGVTLFLDLDGNLTLDENETSFEPSASGSFSQVVPPGRHALGIQVESEGATVTSPKEDPKAHFTFVDFETASEHLDFGIYAPNEQNQTESESDPQNDNSESQPNDPEQGQEQDSTEQNQQPQAPQEVNALYERLLQEVEADAKPLDFDGKVVESPLKGRDY